MAITEYKAKTWKNLPDKSTPINAESLNGLEVGIEKLSQEVQVEFENLPLPTNGKDGAKGDKGEKGDTGAKGDTGEKGDTGAKGDAGAKGANGTAGKDFQVTNSPAPVGSIAVMQADGWKALTVEEFKAHLGIE